MPRQKKAVQLFRKLPPWLQITLLIALVLILFGGYLYQQYIHRPIPLPEGSNFAVHFIDVGQADAALVVCDDAAMLIDGGNAEDSDVIYTYLSKYGVSHLDYIVCTHAHEDHVGGLSGALQYPLWIPLSVR